MRTLVLAGLAAALAAGDRRGALAAGLAVAFLFSSACAPSERQSAEGSILAPDSKRMADGKEWTTRNLDVSAAPSYCYEDSEASCREYGRLYTWDSAQKACLALGDGWRLPTDEEWRQMAKLYGGVSEDAEDRGKAAYQALLRGGGSGFEAVLGGDRSEDGQYARAEAHGFYWTATEIDSATSWCYNFGGGGQALHRQSGLEKQRAISARCIRD